MKKPLCIFCAIMALALMAAALRAAEPAAKPNIVFIMTDDQAPWGVGASGNEQIKTPNLDKLFREGAYLRNAFTTTPVCSPSRATLMTSRYGSELGITDWIVPGKEHEIGVDPKIVIWPEVLQKNGYATGLVGKWHLGVPERFHPTKNGFDYYMGFLEGGTSPKDPTLEKDGKKQKFTGLTTNILTDHALEFIDAHQKEPFLLCLHYRAPHAPYLPVAPEDMDPYRGAEVKVPHPDFPNLATQRVKDMTREYMASISGVDRNVGRVLAKLDELKLADNTVVIFTSDHGYNIGHNGIWHKGNGHWILTEPPPLVTKNVPRGQRPNMFDTSLRVPMAIRWPGVIKPGTEIRETISYLDVYPTLCALGGATAPSDQLIRGRDFSPLLKGEKPADWNNDLYAEYSTKHQSKTHMRVYRTPEWKLKRDFLNPQLDEFYNLKDDPEERTNLIASDDPAVKKSIAELHAKILAKMKETGDPALDLASQPAGE